MTRGKSSKQIYQLKVSLIDSDPLIWRQVLVPSDTLLDDLHLMLQAAMGWQNCHLHYFEHDGVRYGVPAPDFEMDDIDESGVRLSEVLNRSGEHLEYLYDFGDGWQHSVVLESILEQEKGMKYPRCIAGERACPPEDCGGPMGYEEFLQAIGNPDHEEHESFLEWIGGSFDPEKFDMKVANRNLKNYKRMDARNW